MVKHWLGIIAWLVNIHKLLNMFSKKSLNGNSPSYIKRKNGNQREKWTYPILEGKGHLATCCRWTRSPGSNQFHESAEPKKLFSHISHAFQQGQNLSIKFLNKIMTCFLLLAKELLIIFLSERLIASTSRTSNDFENFKWILYSLQAA